MIKIVALLLFIISPIVCVASELPIPIERDGKWGYFDDKGRELISPQFVIANEFSAEKIAAVADEKGWAYIDTRGRILIRPLIVDNGPDPFREGVARFSVSGKFGYFDIKGKVVIEPKFSFGRQFSEGLAAVCFECVKVYDGEHWSMQGGKWGYINRLGELVVPFKFDSIEDFREGSAQATTNGKRLTIVREDGDSTTEMSTPSFVTITEKFDYGTLVEHVVDILGSSDGATLTFSQRREGEAAREIDHSVLMYRYSNEGKQPLSAKRQKIVLTSMLKALQKKFGPGLKLKSFYGQKYLGVEEIEERAILAFKDFAAWRAYLLEQKKYTDQEIHNVVVGRLQEKEVFAGLINTFQELGYEITLSNFEKLFILKAGELSFYAELAEMGIKKSDRFPYPGVVFFSLSQ